MKEFILKVVNEEGVICEIPVPVAKHKIVNLVSEGEKTKKELLLTLENHIRLSMPVSDEDAEWVGDSQQ